MNYWTTLNGKFNGLGNYILGLGQEKGDALLGLMQASSYAGKPVDTQTVINWGKELGIDNLQNVIGKKSLDAINSTNEIHNAFNAGKQAVDATKQATDAAKNATDTATKTDWGGILSGAGDIMSGIGALGSVGLGIYSAIENKKQMEEQLKLARENFNFQKGLANRNLTNQAKAYNQEVGARSALAAAYDRGNANAQANYYDRWRVSEAEVGQAENYKNPYKDQTQGNK